MRNELITKINEIIDENKELKARNDYLEAYKRRSEKACNVATESITETERKLIEIGKKKLLEEILWNCNEVMAFRNEETKEIETTSYEEWIDKKIMRGYIPNNMSQEEVINALFKELQEKYQEEKTEAIEKLKESEEKKDE